jgi:hypothetical protein
LALDLLRQLFFAVSVWLVARTSGVPGDEDRRPPHLTDQQKAKGKVTTKKKHKRDDIEAESAATVVVAIERAERGGRGSGI